MRSAQIHLDERCIGQKAGEDVILFAVGPVFGIGKKAGILPNIALNGTIELAVGLRHAEDLVRMRNGQKTQSCAI